MRKNYIILFILILLGTSLSYGQKPHNNIIVFDITGSMVGKPLPYQSINRDIWIPSIDLLRKQLNSFPKEERITLCLFGENLIKVGSYSTNEGTKITSKIIDKVDSIKINNLTQNYTCIYKSLNSIIDGLDKKYTNTIYLFTDGKNSDGHKACGNITPQELASNWESKTQKSEYLYIFKLKDFSLPSELKGGRIEVIDDALHKLNVVIEPINTVIRISKNNLKSSQQFRITGAGSEYIPNNLTIKTMVIELNSNSETERATTNPEYFSVNNMVQEFTIRTYNKIENIPPRIYNGKLKYSFENGTKNITISENSNITLTITIKDIKTEIIFNNKNEEPKVTIEFID